MARFGSSRCAVRSMRLCWECVGAGPVAGGHQVAGTPVERDMELGIGKARARDDRLEIAGEKSLLLAETHDAHRPEILLEEAARRIGTPRPQGGGPSADLPERVEDR